MSKKISDNLHTVENVLLSLSYKYQLLAGEEMRGKLDNFWMTTQVYTRKYLQDRHLIMKEQLVRPMLIFAYRCVMHSASSTLDDFNTVKLALTQTNVQAVAITHIL